MSISYASTSIGGIKSLVGNTSMLRRLRATLNFILHHPIGARRPLRCLADFAAWQIRARLRSGPYVVTFVNDARLWAKRGETGITGEVYVGLREFEDMAFVAHFLRPGDLFADVGANAGSYAILAAKITGAQVAAIEPMPEAAARLRANILLNGLEELVEVLPCAVGSATGTAWMTTEHDTMNHLLRAGDEATGAVEVPVRTLAEIFAARPPVLLKLDVEGYEREALVGASPVLQGRETIAVVLEVCGDDVSGCHSPYPSARQQLVEHGFVPARYCPWRRQLTWPAEALDGWNQLFIRDPERIVFRLHTAAPIRVKGLFI